MSQKIKWEYTDIDQDSNLISILGVDKFNSYKSNEDIAMVELEDSTIVIYEIKPALLIALRYASKESSLLFPFLNQEAVVFGAQMVADVR